MKDYFLAILDIAKGQLQVLAAEGRPTVSLPTVQVAYIVEGV